MKFLLATRLQQDETPGTVTVEMNKIRFPYVPENFPRSFTRAAREFCPHMATGPCGYIGHHDTSIAKGQFHHG
jgi:hypothetical protein